MVIPPPGETGPWPPVWPSLHPTTQSAYNEILWKRGLPRVEVARLLGVSRTRLTVITKDLEDHGLVVAGPREQRSATGRPAEVLLADLGRYHFMGVHLSGGQAVVAVVDLGNRVVWSAHSPLPTPSAEAVTAVVQRWLDAAATRGLRVAGVGVCPERPLDGEGGGRDLDGLPRQLPADGRRGPAAGVVPLWVDDDITALTAFEQWPRLQPGQGSMVLLALGVEVRMGLVVDQVIVLGAHRASGRVAHLVVAPDGPPCPHGHHGCLWGFTAPASLAAQVPGAADLADVLRAADAGGEGAHGEDADGGRAVAAQRALDAAARALGLAAGAVARVVDPDRLVFAGDSALVLRGREEHLRAALEEALGGAPRADVDVAEPDSVEWAQAAGSLAQYRTFAAAAEGGR